MLQIFYCNQNIRIFEKNNYMSKILFFLSAVLMFCSFVSFSQYSTLGTNFWVTWLPNFDTPENCFIYITSEVGASGTISMPGTGWNQNFSVAPNGAYTFQIPSAQNPVINTFNTPVNRAVRITTNNPVAVYMANQRVASTDASLVLPITALGDDYIVTAYTPFASDQPSQIAIIGVENNTSIQIIPTAPLIGSVGTGVPLNITLNVGQVYVIRSTGDLTGTRIRATNANQCNNFAVFAGNRCAMVPTSCSYCDHLIEQMIPLKAWGKTFITTPLLARNGDQFRIVASENGTQVQINNQTPINLNAGQFHEVYLQQASYIIANKPISVAQYSRGTSCDGASSDPFMIILSPIEQKLKHIVFYSFQAGNVTNRATNIVTKTANISLVTLDGAPLTGWTTVPSNPYYSFVRRNVTTGSHVIHSDSGVVAIVYGYGNVESYGYLAGANVQPLQAMFYVIYNNDTIPYHLFNQQIDCNNQIIAFWVPSHLQLTNIQWNFGDGTHATGAYVTHTYSAGTYTITMYYQRVGSCFIDSIQLNVNVINNLPSIQFPSDTFFCDHNSTLLLDATIPGATQYSWNIPNNGPTYLVTNSGTYSVTASDQYGCSSSASVTVTYIDLQVSIQKTNVSCQGLSDGSATAIVSGGNGPYQFTWNTNPVQTGQSAINIPAGIYVVTVTEANGCTASAQVQIDEGIALNILTQDIDVSCYGYSNGMASVQVQYGTPPYTYLWSTQPPQMGNTASGLSAGSYQVTVTDSQGCSGIANVVIESPTLLLAQMVYISPAGCVGNLGQIEVSGSGGTPPYVYQWNTSPPQYGNIVQHLPAGIYVVTVTDAQGCTATATAELSEIDYEVNVWPATCGRPDGKAEVVVYQYTGSYQVHWSNGQSGTIIENLYSGNYYVTVTDERGNCLQLVHIPEIPGPIASLTVTPTIADVGEDIYFSSQSIGNTWSMWDFGDGMTYLGESINHAYSSSGTYTACLIVRNDYMCEDKDCIQIFIREFVTLYIPNSFSPNGDGVNDVFIVKGVNIDPNHFHMLIYDRWGNKLFESYNMNISWDGRFKDELVTEGIYSYAIVLRDLNGQEQQFRGFIVLYY